MDNDWALIKGTWHYFITGNSLCKKHKLFLINVNPPAIWSNYDGADSKANCKTCDERLKRLHHLKDKS